MAQELPSWTLAELVPLLGGELIGNPEQRISRPIEAGQSDSEGICFAESEKFFQRVKDSQIGAVILSQPIEGLTANQILHPTPRLAFAKFLHLFRRPLPLSPGIHPTAVVDPSAQIDPSAKIGPYVVIGPDSQVGARAEIHPFCYIGDRCSVGAGCVLYPHVVLLQEGTLGEGCRLFPGVALGADGFGYAPSPAGLMPIPQVGSVELGRSVDLGANTTVDRATVGKTKIGDGTKLDNLVMVAHNVQIGPHTVIASQAGIAGSATIGAQVIMGGQSAVKDHVSIADRVTLAGRTGAFGNVESPGEYFGLPAQPVRETLRQMAALKKLPDLVKRLQAIEAALDKLGES